MKTNGKESKPFRRNKIVRGRTEGNYSSEVSRSGPIKHSYVRAPGGQSSVKSRKELRKQQRKAKKAQKHQYLLVKCGREDLVLKAAEALSGKKKKKKKKKRKIKEENKITGAGKSPEKDAKKKLVEKESDSEEDDEDEDEKFVRESVKNKLEKRETMDLAEELKKDGKKMKKEMDEIRRKRLLLENEEEEKTIKQLSKMLKLKSKSKIPASFRTDGLDFVLEACERASSDKKKKKNDGSEEDEDGSEHDLEINESGSEMDAGLGSELEGDDDDDIDDISMDDEENEMQEEEELEDEEEMMEDDAGSDEDDNLDEEIFGSASNSDDEMVDIKEEDDKNEEQLDDKNIKSKKQRQKQKQKKEKEEKIDDGVWEDIYGRMRSKDGAVLDNNMIEISKPEESSASGGKASAGKYVPPALRGNQSQREKLAKQLKGLLNRLSESNMHSIANQVEEMYMANSRNEMNQTLLELLTAALIRPTVMPERVVLEHVMLIAVLHANVGTEVGAFFVQTFTQEFKLKYDSWDTNQNEEDKQLENLLLVISYIYHFKIVDACLIYDILKFLGDRFKPEDVELILTVLRSIGFRLRKDDPAALKELIITLQQKASTQQAGAVSGAKVKFMLEILMAIRNNNMNKIPNYDPSFGEHLLKILKSHLRPGNYVSEMKIGLKDLLNADKAGRWWIVGSAWAGTEKDRESNQADSSNTIPMSSEDALKHAKLMKRARAQGMNTDTRRNIFCILMTAEDYMDAFEKLNHLGLRNHQDREIMHVSTYCCLQEKKFNPYYALIMSKFCSTDRKLMLALQFNLWDRLKDLNSLASHQRNNLANLLVHLINDKSLPLSTLKVVEYAEMDKIKLKFLKKILTGILMQKDVDNLQEIFIKPAMSEKLGMFRESLRLFLNHFMLQASITTSDGSVIKSNLSPEEIEALRGRVKIVEKCMALGKGGLISSTN